MIKDFEFDHFLDDMGGDAPWTIHNGDQLYEIVDLALPDGEMVPGIGVVNMTDRRKDITYSVTAYYVRRIEDETHRQPIDKHLFILTKTNLAQPLPEPKKYNNNLFVQLDMEEIGIVDSNQFLRAMMGHASDALLYGSRQHYRKNPKY